MNILCAVGNSVTYQPSHSCAFKELRQHTTVVEMLSYNVFRTSVQ